MIYAAIKNWIKICEEFFSEEEKDDHQKCDVYSESCKICNPKQS